MLKKVVLGLAVILGAFLGYVALQPSEMNISREASIRAKPEAIFPYINQTKKADEWMPWAEVDPGVKVTYSGPDEGVGSTSSWTSDGQMGVGQAVIVESVKNQSVKTRLTYTKPMEMSQLAEISLQPSGGGTLVRWTVTGQNTFLCRLFTVFMNMDEIVGGQFEKGLAKLKSKVEGK